MPDELHPAKRKMIEGRIMKASRKMQRELGARLVAFVAIIPNGDHLAVIDGAHGDRAGKADLVLLYRMLSESKERSFGVAQSPWMVP